MRDKGHLMYRGQRFDGGKKIKTGHLQTDFKKPNLSTQNLCPGKVSSKNEGRVKTFLAKRKHSLPADPHYNKCFLEWKEMQPDGKVDL